MEKLHILQEDNHILVVRKLPNIPSQADKTEDEDMVTILKQYLKEKYHKPNEVYLGLIHRLDRPVGGVMVFAKTSKAAGRLSEQVRNKEFEKEYLVIIDGRMQQKQGLLEDYLFKNERTNLSKVVPEGTKNAKLAKLYYEELFYQEETNLSVLKIQLQTGRHHQIRVQLASRNHSIYGDQKYGTRGKGKQIALWAYQLSFMHPTQKERISFKCLPEPIGSWKIIENLEV